MFSVSSKMLLDVPRCSEMMNDDERCCQMHKDGLKYKKKAPNWHLGASLVPYKIMSLRYEAVRYWSEWELARNGCCRFESRFRF